MATQETVKQINSGGTLRDVEDVGARQLIALLQNALNALTGGGTTKAIENFNEIISFLENVEDSSTLAGIIAGLNTSIAGKYTKPGTGIPATDLAQAVQSILNDVANKVDVVNGKGLSTNDYTDAEKTKLEGIAAGAQVNIINGIKAHGASTNLPVTNGVVELPEQTEVDLDDYYDKDEVDAAIANKLSNVIVNNIPAGSVSIIDDTTTGGSANAWSAEQGKLMANRSNLAAQRIALLRQLLEHAVFDGDVTDIFDALEALDAAVESITLNQSSLTFSGSTTPGATQTLVATTDPAGANVSWSSSDSSVATVNNGVVTAVDNGTCVITASAGGLSATCNVAVSGILAVYEISLGTLSHVSVTDGNGDAISDGDEITEGSALTIVLTPDASHVIDTASVTMGGVAQTLTDGQDGEKMLTIASVSGDIVISASATYQAKDYADDAIALTSYGVQPSGGSFAANNKTDCLVMELDFGKVYHLTGWNWKSQGGTSAGFNFALVKSDGNGGYANIISGTDVTIPSGGLLGEIQVTSANRIVMESNAQLARCKDNFVFSVPPASSFSGVDKVYLAINTRWETALANTMPISVKEINVGSHADMFYAGLKPQLAFLQTNDNDYNCRLYAVDFGKSYSYSGYDWTGGTNNGYIFGVVGIVGGVFHLFTPSQISNLDQFFTSTSYAERVNAPTSGSFTTPSQSAISVAADKLFILANTKWSGDSITMPDFTLTENS